MKIDWEKEARELLANNEPWSWLSEPSNVVIVPKPPPFTVKQIDEAWEQATDELTQAQFNAPRPVRVLEPERKPDFAAITALIARGS